jgi:hypothetical protein
VNPAGVKGLGELKRLNRGSPTRLPIRIEDLLQA